MSRSAIIIFAFLIGLLGALSGLLINKNLSAKLRVEAQRADALRRETIAATLVDLVRGDLLAGDLVKVRAKFERVCSSGLVEGIRMIPKAETSDDVLDILSPIGKFPEMGRWERVEIFFPNSSEKWGQIEFLFSEKSLEDAVNSASGIAKTISFVSTLVGILFGLVFLTLVSGAAIRVIRFGAGDPLLARKNPAVKIWMPLYQVLAQKEAQFKSEQQKNFELEKQVALAEVAKKVAHDLRSPIAALRAVNNALQTTQEKHYQLVSSTIERIQGIADSLLRPNRNSDRKVSTVESAILKALEIKQLELVAADTEFKIHIPNELSALKIPGGEADWMRILSNLINNGIEASRVGGNPIIRVELSATQNDFLKLEIQDHGIGMSADVLARLGESGFSEGKDELLSSGSGLGVASVRLLVEKIGGRLEYHSAPGKGTTAQVTFPKVIHS